AVNVAIAVGLTAALALAAGPLGLEPRDLVFRLGRELVGINLMLAAFNMIPAFPMDGGRVLRAILSGWLGRERATAVAATVGRGLALAAGLYFLLTGMFIQAFLAGFIFLAAGMELAHVKAEEHRRRYASSSARDGIWFVSAGFPPTSGRESAQPG